MGNTPVTKASKEKKDGKDVATRDPATQSYLTLRDLLEKSKAQLAAALPKHLTVERQLRIALTTIRRTPQLLLCDPLTVVGAIMQASELGLELDGVRGHAYLVPRWNKNTKRKEANFQIGYKGIIDLARRSGEVADIDAQVVYSKDIFDYEQGFTPRLRFVRSLDADRGTRLAVYAFCKTKDGEFHVTILSMADVERLRKRSQSPEEGPWTTDYDAMAKKTAVRQMAPFLPLSPEFQKAATLDDLAEADVDTNPDLEVTGVEAIASATAAAQQRLVEKYRETEKPGETLELTAPTAEDLAALDAKDAAEGKEREPGSDA